ncbi:MAG TPA: hypothetical protein VFV90_13175 [Usitatibacter sp.]|nr:hypothetical protein [Usitatibacter sp.]
MAISSLLLAGVLAMGPQWSIVDLPYPEVKAPESMGGYVPSTETQVNETIASWVKRTSPGRKHEVTQVRIDGPKATARIVFPDRTWQIRLERDDKGWKVIEK